MTVTYAIVGAPTHTGATVVAEITGTSARLAVQSGDLGANGPLYFGPVAAVNGAVELVATGLDPDSRWVWQVEEDGVLDTSWTGSFRTLRAPGSVGVHTTAWTSCSGAGNTLPGAVVVNRVSNHPAYDAIREHPLDPVVAIDVGDKHYRDIGSGTHSPAPYDEDDYRSAYRDCWTFNETLGADARQGRLYRNVPIAYVWDNHDYSWATASHIDADKHAPARDAACRAYRERIPHYPLPEPEDTGGIYQTFVIDRVRYILLDVRSYREPNANPDGPGHTMLGQRQREWLQNLLATAQEQFLVLGSAGQWITQPTETDTWARFNHERNEIVSWLAAGDWLDRMCVVTGSDHALAADTGANNRWGGFPVFLFSSMDSTPSAPKPGLYDRGHYPGKGQYGTLTIADTGSTITVTGIGWNESTPIVSHAWSVPATPVDPGPGPDPLPPDTPATETAEIQWYACDAVTGDVIRPMPGVTGDIERALSSYSTSTLKLPAPLWGPLALGPMAWTVTQPGRVMYVCVINGTPAWAGIVTRVRDGVGVDVELGVASLEAYLWRHYVTTHRWTGVDESVIVRGLLADAQDNGIRMVVDAPPTGRTRDRQYWDDEDATVGDRLQELSDVEGGPDWMIEPVWEIPERRIVGVFRLRPRIGSTVPRATLSTTGQTRAAWTRTRDYGHGMGATHVIATGSGEGEDRRMSPIWIDEAAEAAGMPRYEYRFSPSSSITSQGVLGDHARRMLRQISRGTTTLEITVRRDAEPGRYGIDWGIGDTVRYDLRGHLEPLGITGTGRVIGWRMAVQGGLITPVLVEET